MSLELARRGKSSKIMFLIYLFGPLTEAEIKRIINPKGGNSWIHNQIKELESDKVNYLKKIEWKKKNIIGIHIGKRGDKNSKNSSRKFVAEFEYHRTRADNRRYEVTSKWISDLAKEKSVSLEDPNEIQLEILKNIRFTNETPVIKHSLDELRDNKEVDLIKEIKDIAQLLLIERIAISRTFKSKNRITEILKKIDFNQFLDKQMKEAPVNLGETGKILKNKQFIDYLWDEIKDEVIIDNKEKYKSQITGLALAVGRTGSDKTIIKMIELFGLDDDPFKEKIISYNLELILNQEKKHKTTK